MRIAKDMPAFRDPKRHTRSGNTICRESLVTLGASHEFPDTEVLMLWRLLLVHGTVQVVVSKAENGAIEISEEVA